MRGSRVLVQHRVRAPCRIVTKLGRKIPTPRQAPLFWLPAEDLQIAVSQPDVHLPMRNGNSLEYAAFHAWQWRGKRACYPKSHLGD